MDIKELAEILYEAYNDAAYWQTSEGLTTPEWNRLSGDYKSYWEEVANKVIELKNKHCL